MKKLLLTALLAVAVPAWADAVDTLKSFVQDVKSGRAAFTQTVTSPDGAKKRTTQGSFAFSRPGRFRFEYDKPFEQLIVADGQKVWLYDPDLNQVTVRPMSQALGATPAALLAGGALEKDFRLNAMPDRDGLQWAEAVPREKDSQFQSVRVGFRGGALAALEILDNFGQKSLLSFSQVQSNAAVAADDFRFTPPQGADVLEQ
jgi:outer membrane lipoprotein carrier protein